MLYQLSYSREDRGRCAAAPAFVISTRRDGGEGNRTPDLVNAIHALSQLSYAPRLGLVQTDVAGPNPK